MSETDPAVTIDPELGRAMPSLGWVPAPRFLLRRAEVLRVIGDASPGRVLEVGAGAGSLFADIAMRGFSGVAVETSEAARALATRMLADQQSVEVTDELPPAEPTFDYLMAFEVLEHITDAKAMLQEWLKRLRPGGRVLLSVPAYAKRWTSTDTWAGHVRRYDRRDLIALAERVGLTVRSCTHYGFPLADAIEPINAAVRARRLKHHLSRDERSAESGIQRSVETRLFPLIRSWPGRLGLRAAVVMQRWFANANLGNGLLLDAELPR